LAVTAQRPLVADCCALTAFSHTRPEADIPQRLLSGRAAACKRRGGA